MSSLNPTLNRNKVRRVKKVDPHHCTCFSIQKQHFLTFEAKLKGLGFVDPILDEDHGQILSYTRRLSEYYQIHVKLMRNGRLEAGIEYPPEYPMAHLNSTHSFSAHAELNALLIAMQMPFKSRRSVPITCKQRQIIPAKQPTHLNTFLAVGGACAVLDLILNDGKLTSKTAEFLLEHATKSMTRRANRRKYLT
jgi:hypothetical protein